MQTLYRYWTRMKNALSNPAERDRGVSVVEWVIITACVVGLALVAVGVITALVNDEIASLP